MAPSDNGVIEVVECEEESGEARSVGGIGVPGGGGEGRKNSQWMGGCSQCNLQLHTHRKNKIHVTIELSLLHTICIQRLHRL